jgi:hypothetical protein
MKPGDGFAAARPRRSRRFLAQRASRRNERSSFRGDAPKRFGVARRVSAARLDTVAESRETFREERPRGFSLATTNRSPDTSAMERGSAAALRLPQTA